MSRANLTRETEPRFEVDGRVVALADIKASEFSSRDIARVEAMSVDDAFTVRWGAVRIYVERVR
jgi:hypothetical protein